MVQPVNILGISAYQHDSAAALLRDGRMVAAAQEERFTRMKHDAGFPRQAAEYCLAEGRMTLAEVQRIVFFDEPPPKFEHLFRTCLGHAPRGLRSLNAANPDWFRERLFLKSTLRRELARLAGCRRWHVPPVSFAAHGHAQAASAFYVSPFRRAAVLCIDGVAERPTTSAWLGTDGRLEPLWEIGFPHSLGFLYSAFTGFTGFRVHSEERQLMGLAAFGEPRYTGVILDKLMRLEADGTFRLDTQYFDYRAGRPATSPSFAPLFGGPPRAPHSGIAQREMDIAASIQRVAEEVVLRLARKLHDETGVEQLGLAGGLTQNCVANGRLLREGPFREIWIQPAAGEAGGAIGAAAATWYEDEEGARAPNGTDAMQGAFLGPAYTGEEIAARLQALGARFTVRREGELYPLLAQGLDEGRVIGWFQGRMELGPRALGSRSIIADPRNDGMRSLINSKVKCRDSFRPFAASVLADRIGDYFELDRPSPYMLFAAPVSADLRLKLTPTEHALTGMHRLKVTRSALPAVTDVSCAACVQTVHRETNPRYHRLLQAFESRTGCAVLLNTSFNLHGEPIVCTPEDAYRAFLQSGMDYLVLENLLLARSEQPALPG